MMPAVRLGSCLLAVGLLRALPARAEAAGFARGQFIGFRGDGSGVFPSDCQPVTTWNEWDFREEGQGRDATLVPVGENRVHIVWKTPADMQCNGGMIVAGGKLFVMVDRGGYGYAVRNAGDFVGPLLVCLDPADGKVLWRRELDHLDRLPADVRRQVRQDVLDYWAWWVRTYSAHARWYHLAKKITKGQPLTPTEEKAYPQVAAEYQKLLPPGVLVPQTSKEVPDSEFSRWVKGYVQTTFWGVEKTYFKDQVRKKNGLTEYGYCWNAWYGQGSLVGSAMPTPVSDGRRVYVFTGYNDAFCYDLEGNRVWGQWFGPQGPSWGAFLTSPILVGDVMITHAGTAQHKDLRYRALDRRTGKLLWEQVNYPSGKSYHMITPVAMSLPVGDTGEAMDVIWTGPGTVFRVRDGKVLGEKIGCHGNARHVGVSGDVIVLVNGSSDGGHGSPYTFAKGTVAVRLVAQDAETVTGQMLWHDAKGPERLVVHDGLVYGFTRDALEVRDLETGKVVAEVGRPAVRPFHVSAIAGGYLFALGSDGQCLVTTLGRDIRPVAVNRLGTREHSKGDYFNQGAQPFFSGNRIFLRSYTDVYCIGDPNAPLRLSKEHR